MIRNFFLNSKALLAKKQTNILSAAGVIMVTVFLSRILGLVRDRLLASTFFGGSEWQLDVYFAAFRIPDMIFQLIVAGALSAAFIPVFSHYLRKKEEEAWKIGAATLNAALLIFLLIAVIFFLNSRLFCSLVAPKFEAQKLNLMVRLSQLMIGAQFFFIISNFLTGVLQSHQRFLLPAIAPVVYNLGIILGIMVFSPFWGIYGPTLGVVIGAFLHLLIQIPLAFSLGFKPSFNFNFKHPGVVEIGRLMLPRTLSLAVSQIELTIAVFIATSLTAGSLSIFYFAQHLNALPVGLFGMTIGQAALPTLATEADKNWQDFKNTLITTFLEILFLALPASALLLILRIPLVRLVFGARAFPWQATLLTGKVVAIFSVSVFAQCLTQLLVRGFYSLHDTKTPFLISALTVFLNVMTALMLTFYYHWGVLGLATATTVTSLVHAGLLFYFLGKKVNGFEKEKLIMPVLKMILATMTMMIGLWMSMRFLDLVLDTTRTLNLLFLTAVSSFLGFSIYLGLAKLLEIKEMESFLGLLRKRGEWQEVLEKSTEVLDGSEKTTQQI